MPRSETYREIEMTKPETGQAAVRPSRPLRIVHTVSSLLCGGMENFVIRLAAAQKAAGHDVAILALKGGPLLREAVGARLKVATLGPWGLPFRLARGLAFIAAHRPDIVHAHNSTSWHFAAAGKVGAGAKLVFTDHGVKISRKPSKWEVRATDAAVAVSERTALDRRNSYGPLCAFDVIQNGIDFESATVAREITLAGLNLPEGPTGIIVARLEPVKNQEMLLRAVDILNRNGVMLNLLVVGDGTQRNRLEALACELNLSQERVRFLGFRHDIPNLLTAADFFVLASRDEGLPLAMLEGMSHGLPVVSTSVGGVPEVVVNGENGLLVESDDVTAMAHAIGLLVNDHGLRGRIGAAGRRRVEQSFSFQRTAREYEQLYYRIRPNPAETAR